MDTIDGYQEAIWITLLSSGPLTYNQLFWATQKTKKCSRNTFQKHLSQLVNNFRVLKNKKGSQTIEYSLPMDLTTNTKSIIDMLDDFDNQLNELDMKSFEIYLKMNISKEKRKMRYQEIISMITNLLKIIKFTTLTISLRVLDSITTNKLKKITKRCILYIQKIMQIIKKIDSKLHLAINIRILNEIELI